MRLSQLRHVGSTQFWILSAFIVFVFLVGGGSRADIKSLIVLRPVAVLVCGYALWNLRMEDLRRFGVLFGMAAAILLAVAVQLVLLPPSIWMMLPGHGLVAEIDRVAALGPVWRPISLTPDGTWNALFSLSVPLAVLLLAAQITREERYRLLPLLIGLGMLSGLLGLMQVSGPANGPLYFYNTTNADSAVGLFANRNHAAVFLACLFPMLAVFASAGLTTIEQVRRRTWASIAMCFFLIPLIIVTGSRAGLLIGVIALATVPLLYRPPFAPNASSKRTLAYVGAGAALVALVLVFMVSSQDEAVSRLLGTSSEELRFKVWGPIAEIAWRYFPFGSGAGSFAEIFQVHEPYQQLRINYLNHAHNDWLELYLTGGILALLLMAFAVAAWAVRSFGLWRRENCRTRGAAFGRMASVILLLLAIASLGDYPSRTPSIMCLLTLMAVWMKGSGAAEAEAEILSGKSRRSGRRRSRHTG